MWRERVLAHFDSGHRIVNHPGKCQRLHGHTWHVELFVKATELDRLEMGVDFGLLKAKLKEIVDRLDHRMILWKEDPLMKSLEPLQKFFGENLEALKTDYADFVIVDFNPTAEKLAEYIYNEISNDWLRNNLRLKIDKVRIWEGNPTRASYAEFWR